MKYRPVCGTKPCNQCPFRRKAMPGWLGEATPESFIIEISMERPLPCHPTMDYWNKDWLEKWEEQRPPGKICAGSLILMENMAKVPRDSEFPRLTRDTKTVFANHREFLDFHNNAPVKSWEMRKDWPDERKR